MDIERLRKKISLLRNLANHPSATAQEAENAKERIQELNSKVSTLIASKKESERKNRTRVIIRRVKKERPLVWPGGWHKGKNRVEYERVNDDYGVITIAWNCPDCKKLVSHNITPIDIRRIKGQSGGVEGHIGKLTNGEYNQLCSECYKGYC